MACITPRSERRPPRVSARDNVFAVQRLDAAPAVVCPDAWSSMWSRFEASGRRGSIVGPHGAGKTTLVLRRVAPELCARGFTVRRHHLTRQDRRLPAGFLDDLGPRDAVVIDSAEQLNAWTWRTVRRRLSTAGAWITTAHGRGRGPTVLEHRGDLERLESLVEAVTGGGAAYERWRPRLAALLASSPGDLRTVLRRLYDEASFDVAVEGAE